MIGCVVGLVCRSARHIQNRWLYAIVVSTAAAILGVKSIVEVILYAQPML